MKVKGIVASLAALALLGCAQETPPADADEFKAPRFSDEYLAKLKQLPDWNGRWRPWASKPRPAEIAFDPENFYSPPDPAGPEDEGAGLVGLIEGTYLTSIPYNDEWKAEYEHNVQEALEGRSVDRVGACEPYGFPRVMGGNPSGPEIFVTPEVVLMYFDAGSAVRHIYTDGRGHPKGEGFDTDVAQRWNGHSIGRWEGDTLVVDTIGMFAAHFDQTAAPFSEELHVVERIRQIDENTLEVQMTLEDPIAFTRPWQVTRYFKRDKEKFPKVSDNTCPPGNFIDMSMGYQRVILPAEREAMEEAARRSAGRE